MITKEEAMQLRYGQEIHCNIVRTCKRVVGPRGGVKDIIIRVRVTGQCKTWKTRPNEFRVPVKYGLYESGELTERNAEYFHFASACPALNENEQKQASRQEHNWQDADNCYCNKQ